MGEMTGKQFEELIKDSCEKQGLSYTRLKDAGWMGEDTQRRFTPTNVCDCIIFDGSTLLFAEAKHRRDRVEFAGLKQLGDLLKKKDKEKQTPNISYGFLFCIKGQFFYGSAEKLSGMAFVLAKKSFNLQDAEDHLIKIGTYLPARARKERLDLQSLFQLLKSTFN